MVYFKQIRIVEQTIPKSIKDMHLNIKNRQHAIEEYMYGPANPESPGDYWSKLGEVWGVDGDQASTMRCGNCAAFNVKDETKQAIAGNISDNGMEVVDTANLGYCELFDFKCAGDRSCIAWLTGGPLK